MAYNRVILHGRLINDVEVKTAAASSIEVAPFTIAVDRRTSKDQQKITDFIDCVAFGKTANFIATYFGKGSGIIVEGKLQQNRYTDKDGKNRYSYNVAVDDVKFDGSKKSESGESAPHEKKSEENFSEYKTFNANRESDAVEVVDDDDELPF